MIQIDVEILLDKSRLAVKNPRIYVIQYFEELINQIDVHCQKTLNEFNNKRIVQQQTDMVEKAKEFESYCIYKLEDTPNEDKSRDLKIIIDQIEKDLEKQQITEIDLENIYWILLNELLEIEKDFFQGKTMLFLKAGENLYKKCEEDDDEHNGIPARLEFFSKELKLNNFLGQLILIEDCYIQNEVFMRK